MKTLGLRVPALALSLATLSGCVAVNRMTGMSQAQDLQRTGVPAPATILRIWDTGMTLNEDPVVGFLLEVHPPEAEPWEAETKIVVSRLAIPRIQPGRVVGVRYDPAQPTRVSLDLGAWDVAPPLPEPTPPPRAADVEAEKQRLLATGVPGTATIVHAHPLGLFDADGRPVYDLMLTVEVPGRLPTQGPARVGVTREREAWFRVGQKLPVKADPEHPAHFAVDWERLEVPAPAPAP